MTNVTVLIFAEAWRDHFRGEGPGLRVSFRRDPLAAQRGTEFRRQTDAISSRNCPRTGLDIDRTRSDGGTLTGSDHRLKPGVGGGEAIKHHLAPTERGKGVGLV